MSCRAQVPALVEAVLRAWNARDLDAFTALLTPDVYWHDLGMPSPPAVGREAVRRFSESILRAFPDFRYEIRHPICIAEDGSCCVIPWTITATNTGPLNPPGFAPTGRRVHFHGLDYFKFRDNLVAHIETRFDPAEPVEQMFGLRVRPLPGSLKERCFVWFQRAQAAWIRRRPG
ncbi:MAG: nuclear transport factor 2 family protein [Opitutaceae bacterium]|nr:nuclear transport factor 2 family protein [Opitutaceae bacterium]